MARYFDPIDGPPLAGICDEFDAYMDAGGYEPAFEICPWDSESGGFVFTDGLAMDLIPGFEESLGRKLTSEETNAIESYCGDIGEVSRLAFLCEEERQHVLEEEDDVEWNNRELEDHEQWS